MQLFKCGHVITKIVVCMYAYHWIVSHLTWKVFIFALSGFNLIYLMFTCLKVLRFIKMCILYIHWGKEEDVFLWNGLGVQWNTNVRKASFITFFIQRAFPHMVPKSAQISSTKELINSCNNISFFFFTFFKLIYFQKIALVMKLV